MVEDMFGIIQGHRDAGVTAWGQADDYTKWMSINRLFLMALPEVFFSGVKWQIHANDSAN